MISQCILELRLVLRLRRHVLSGRARLVSAAVTAPRRRTTAVDDPPAHISVVDGTAVLERDGRPEPSPAVDAAARRRSRSGPRTAASRCSSPTAAPCTSTPTSTVDFQSDEVVRLLDGRVRLTIPGRGASVSYRIDAPSGVGADQRARRVPRAPSLARPRAAGRAGRASRRGGARERGGPDRVSRRRARVRPRRRRAVVRRTSTTPRPGTRSIAGRKPRRDQRLGASAQYLPDDVRPYSSTFDTYGAWRYDASYGYVWYPRSASAGGRTTTAAGRASVLTAGRGSARDPWAWPTHHYGRWGFSTPAVVLDSGTNLGTGLGVVGVRAGLRELVSARLEQPRGLRLRTSTSTAATATIRGTPGRSCRSSISAPATSTCRATSAVRRRPAHPQPVRGRRRGHPGARLCRECDRRSRSGRRTLSVVRQRPGGLTGLRSPVRRGGSRHCRGRSDRSRVPSRGADTGSRAQLLRSTGPRPPVAAHRRTSGPARTAGSRQPSLNVPSSSTVVIPRQHARGERAPAASRSRPATVRARGREPARAVRRR